VSCVVRDLHERKKGQRVLTCKEWSGPGA
jgi:hypothetical protein